MESPNNDLTSLKNLREHYRSRAFRLAIGILFIFGIPAAAAFFGGRALDAEGEKQWQLIFLATAFVLSWVVLIVIWRNIDKGLRETDRQIKAIMDSRRAGGLLKPIEDK
jgi:predicted tellurium resistance membrane protein TerC